MRPYRHFRDKDELLEAIAVEGFERLTAPMKKRSAAGATANDRRIDRRSPSDSRDNNRFVCSP
jgi:AcrR family transcriptional regulator